MTQLLNDPFWTNIFRRRTSEEQAEAELLRKVPIFQDLTGREFVQLERILHRRSYATDDYIVREGDVGVGMYVIISGKVDIVQGEDAKSRSRLATFERGDFFGEQGLLDESPRTASAVTLGPTRAIGFFRPDLLDIIERYPRLGLKIVLHLSQMISVRLRHTNRLLKETQDRGGQAQSPRPSGQRQ
jgi:CRP/FNR family transcriptional regulator, cyclic AMP receptor protein